MPWKLGGYAFEVTSELEIERGIPRQREFQVEAPV